jgi:hypothetical protein
MRKLDMIDVKANAAIITGKAVSFIAKDLHFTFQSLADGVRHGEAKIINKLTGAPKSLVMEYRVEQTKNIQANIKENMNKFNKFMSNLASTKSLDDDPIMSANPPQNSSSHE